MFGEGKGKNKSWWPLRMKETWKEAGSPWEENVVVCKPSVTCSRIPLVMKMRHLSPHALHPSNECRYYRKDLLYVP